MHFTEYYTRLASYAVIVDEAGSPPGERGPLVLLSWWNGEGRGEPCWSLPGGGVEFEETVEQGTIREAREETGYDVALDALLTVQSEGFLDTPDGVPFRRVRVVHAAHVVGGELGTLEVGGSTDYARWLPLADVPDLPRSSVVDLGLTAWLDRRAGLAAG